MISSPMKKSENSTMNYIILPKIHHSTLVRSFCRMGLEQRLASLHGVFSVFKPAGQTSSDVVERLKKCLIDSALAPVIESVANGDNKAKLKKLRKNFSKKLRVGHGGTLDPMATGVLVVGVNDGCKRLQEFLKGSKVYKAGGRFGVHYDSLDVTGQLLAEDEQWKGAVDEEKFKELLKSGKFIGEAVMQKPPAFSAIHINGVRAYKLAREASQQRETEKIEVKQEKDETALSSDSESNEEEKSAVVTKPQVTESVDIPARPVTIYSIDLTDSNLPDFSIEIKCGGGCYVRSIIRDLAQEMGTLAAMTSLVRTQQGLFTLELTVPEEDWKDLERVREALKRSEALLK